jgi:pimeloyl-ACP methyl ester carboxylesterase
MMLLAAIVALVLSAAATGLAASPSGSDSAKDTLGKGELGKNKDFSGLVDIGGGRKMYMECHGKGSPTVVLVSGGRGAYDDWTHVIDSGGEPKPSGSAVFPQVGKFTRVCAYDRPGTTRLDGTLSPSTPVRQPTTAQDGAADLHVLLRAAKQKGPYVIVAHSWGGLIGRLYASTYPDEVSGLVLLDPGSEFLQNTLTPAQWEKFIRAAKQPGKPKDLEAADYQPSVRALRAAPPVRSIPAVALTSDKCFEFVPGAGGAKATCQAWRAAQDQLAELLNAKHITDTNSGHFIQGEQPQLVIDAIREVVFEVRGSSTATAIPTATSSPTATASPAATALASSGGPPLVAPLVLAATLALVCSGLAALGLLRRNAS